MNYNKTYRRKSSGGGISWRRRSKKISLVLLIIGLLCPLLSLFFFANYFLVSNTSKSRMLIMALAFLLSGIFFLIVRVIFDAIRNRFEHRKPTPYIGEVITPRTPLGTNGFSNQRTNDKDGMVLIMVLVLLGLLTALVLQVQFSAAASARREQLSRTRQQIHLSAFDAAQAALRRLASDDEPGVDYLKEKWAESEDFKNPAGVAVRCTITDENRYFNLNNLVVPPSPSATRTASDMLMDLMTLSGDFSPVTKVEALKDWMDSDTDGFHETSFYKARKPSYFVPNRILYAWNELLWVEGFSRDLFKRHIRQSLTDAFNENLADGLTILPISGASIVPVNINTASRAVLQAVVGIAYPELVETVLALREANPFVSLEALAATMNPELAQTLRPYLDTKSRFFRIESQGYLDGMTERIMALAYRNERGDVSVLQWIF